MHRFLDFQNRLELKYFVHSARWKTPLPAWPSLPGFPSAPGWRNSRSYCCSTKWCNEPAQVVLHCQFRNYSNFLLPRLHCLGLDYNLHLNAETVYERGYHLFETHRTTQWVFDGSKTDLHHEPWREPFFWGHSIVCTRPLSWCENLLPLLFRTATLTMRHACMQIEWIK